MTGILLASSAGTAVAGTEPSPFRVNLARLDYVAMSVSSAPDMIAAVLGVQPEPFCPVPDNVAAKEIGDLAKQMQRNEDKVMQVIETLDLTCDPLDMGAVVERLGNIRTMTVGIIDMINERLGVEPEPFKVTNALDKLKRNAESLINTIDAFTLPVDTTP
jgi:hypothetical protein